jgi:hypothetical protein|tara:strand:- start:186 stop:362 length:177 start_codon:yes stop_codon:yes gene_type:complete
MYAVKVIANVAKGYALAKNVKRENPVHVVVLAAVVKKSVAVVNNQLNYFLFTAKVTLQ